MPRKHVAWIGAGLAVTLALGTLYVLRQPADHDDVGCTLVGCTSAVTVQSVDLAYASRGVTSVRVCIDGHCVVRPRDDGYKLLVTRAIGGQQLHIPVTTSLLDARGRTITTDARVVRRKRSTPNGEGCPGVCFVGGAFLRPDGTLHDLPTSESRRLPSSSRGQPRVHVIADGRVRRLGPGLRSPAPLRVRRGAPLQIRTDRRSYVRVFAPGHRPPSDPYPFEGGDPGRVWIADVPRRLDGIRYLIVRLDHRTDRRVVELRLPITPAKQR